MPSRSGVTLVYFPILWFLKHIILLLSKWVCMISSFSVLASFWFAEEGWRTVLNDGLISQLVSLGGREISENLQLPFLTLQSGWPILQDSSWMHVSLWSSPDFPQDKCVLHYFLFSASSTRKGGRISHTHPFKFKIQILFQYSFLIWIRFLASVKCMDLLRWGHNNQHAPYMHSSSIFRAF